MGKGLDFSKFKNLFDSGVDFEITEQQYMKEVGKELPKGTNYLKKQSAIAKKAREHGYVIEVIEESITRRKLAFKSLTNI